MKQIRWSAAMAVLAGALVAAQSASATALPGPVMTVPMAQAVQTPVPVGLLLGQPAIVRLERPITAVTDSPPGVVHPIIHGSTVLLVPLREGSTVLAIGVGDRSSVKLAVSIGTEAGARLITLTGSAVAAARPAPSQTQAPRSEPDAAPASTADPAAQNDPPASTVDGFIATLSIGQRQALMDYLRSPSLASLSALVRLLNPSQQHMLVQVLASRTALPSVTAQTPQAVAPAAVQASPSTAPTVSTTRPTKPDRVDPGVTVSAPAGITVHVIPTVARGVLYLSYVLQNETGTTVRADPHEVDIAGVGGPITVRQMDVGTPGEIAPGSMETGVIVLTPAGAGVRVSITWRLRDDAGDAMPLGIVVGLR